MTASSQRPKVAQPPTPRTRSGRTRRGRDGRARRGVERDAAELVQPEPLVSCCDASPAECLPPAYARAGAALLEPSPHPFPAGLVGTAPAAQSSAHGHECRAGEAHSGGIGSCFIQLLKRNRHETLHQAAHPKKHWAARSPYGCCRPSCPVAVAPCLTLWTRSQSMTKCLRRAQHGRHPRHGGHLDLKHARRLLQIWWPATYDDASACGCDVDDKCCVPITTMAARRTRPPSRWRIRSTDCGGIRTSSSWVRRPN